MTYHDGNGGGNGGGNGAGSAPPTGDNILNLSNAAGEDNYAYVETPFNFTDPPRYFKANDPYYYAVDNLPLKQLHENCLWLRDQILGKDLSVTGISLEKIVDLQPYVTNSDRVVNVRPGRFTARVNDAYGFNAWASIIENATGSVDVTRTPMYKTPSVQVDDSVFKTLVGSTVVDLLYNNGLYEHYHHHASKLYVSPPADTAPTPGTMYIKTNLTPTFFGTGSFSIEDLPKIKTAVWQQLSDTNRPEPYLPDLQQLSVDFCRRWKGVFRTAVVNVPEQLSIQVPAFNEEDYLDNETTETYDAQVRLDLLFLYTHPVDASESFIAKNAGEGPERITQPRLGLVKGAGSILTPASYDGGDTSLDIVSDPSIIGNEDWLAQRASEDGIYKTQQGLSDIADVSITSPLSDQVGVGNLTSPFPTKNTGYSFPSPDDLLNLAPIISADATTESLATIGQSVLPLCYIIVKKDATVIRQEDIIDIRPFLRTAELTYNERAGVAGANPPLSLANPATGKAELYTAVETMRDYLVNYLAETVTGTTITTERTVFKSQADLVRSANISSWGSAASNLELDLTSFVGAPHLGKVKYFLFRVEPTQSDCQNPAKLYFTQGTGINEARRVGQFEGGGAAATTAMPHSFFWPGTHTVSESGDTQYSVSTYSTYSGDGTPNFYYKLYMDGYVYEDQIIIETSV